MKKSIIFMLVLVLIMSVFSFNICAKNITLKFAHVCPPSHPYQIGAEKFAELVKEKSNGEITINIYPSAQLGQERDLIEGLQMGTIDIAISSLGVTANFVPSMTLFALPFIFKNADHFTEIAKGPIGEKVLESCKAKKLKGLGLFAPIFRMPMTNVRPIQKPEDFKGLRIRLMEVPLHMDTYKAMGASVIPLPGGELYTALQLGTVDGCENAIATLYTYKFYEQLKYLSILPVVSNGAVALMSDKVWNELSSEQQEVIVDCMPEALDSADKAYLELDEVGLQKIKEAGKEVFRPDLEPFKEKVKPVCEKYIKELPDWVRDAYLEIVNN